MRKLAYIISLFVFVTTNNYAQQLHKAVADTEFFYFYGGVNPDIARSVKETYDKGYIVAGTSSSFGNGDADIYLIKTDSLGKHQWSKTFGGHQNDWGYSVQVATDSGYFIAGYSNSFNPQNGFDAYYLRTDKLGNLLWEKTVSGTDWDFIYGSTPMSDGGFILCGETFTNSHGGSDAYLIRLNKNGDTLWTKNYGGLFDETFRDVLVIQNIIYAVGKNATHATDTIADAWIVKLDTNGVILKDTYISGPRHYEEVLNSVSQHTSGRLYLCGTTNVLDSNATTGILARLDTSFTAYSFLYPLVGSTSPGSEISLERAFGLSNGNVCAIGSAIGGYGGHNMFFISFDSTGGYVNDYARHSGGPAEDYGYGGIITSKGRIIGVGSAEGFCSGLEDIFLVRFNSDSIQNSALSAKSPVITCYVDTLPLWQVSMQSIRSELKFQLFPNPASNATELQISSPSQQTYVVKAFSVLGNEVLSTKARSNIYNSIDISSLDEGSYFLKLLDENGQTISVLKLIVSR
ncbi:MAG: T9SS type A sorting domain-containing protein [Bacteroidia bacterium]